MSIGCDRAIARSGIRPRAILASLAVIWCGSLCTGALAKDFKPGDIRVCNTSRCVPIESRGVLRAIDAFYYDSAHRPTAADAPVLGGPYFQIEFRNGYVSGIVAGRALDRFLSGGVNLEQFSDNAWYRVPPTIERVLQRLTVGLAPLRLTRAVLNPSTLTPNEPAPATVVRSPRAHHRQRDSVPWPLLLVALAAMIALALVARHHLTARPRLRHARSAVGTTARRSGV
jgi:hypothetical protein